MPRAVALHLSRGDLYSNLNYLEQETEKEQKPTKPKTDEETNNHLQNKT